MRVASYLAAAILAFPLAALAGGTAIIQSGEGRFTLAYDGTRLRLDSDQHRGVRLIARDGKVYAVSSAAGQPIVVEGSAVMALLGARGGKQPLATGDQDIARFVSLEPTGRKETVGGLTGTVHHLTYVDRNGRRRTEEAVLSDNPALAELTRNFGQVATAFQQSTGVDNQGARDLLQELASRELGLLRFADHYRLVSLDTTTPPASYFQLPGSPLQLQGLESLLPALTGSR